MGLKTTFWVFHFIYFFSFCNLEKFLIHTTSRTEVGDLGGGVPAFLPKLSFIRLSL